jgi:hypothetical protein
MRITTRGLATSLAGFMALALTISACTDQDGVLPPIEIPEVPVMAKLTCTGNVQTRSLECRNTDTGAGPAASLANHDQLIVGNQGTYVTLRSSNITVDDADDGPGGDVDFNFDVTLENLLRQPFGTTDQNLLAPHVDGVRIFFHTGPTATPAGVAAVLNEDGSGTFTGTGQPYFQYNSVSLGGSPLVSSVRWGDTTTAKNWTLRLSSEVVNFSFTLYVASEVPFPGGWTDVVPNAVTVRRFVEDSIPLTPLDSVQLSTTVRNTVGTQLPSGTITYLSSNPLIATVNATGKVFATSTLGSTRISGSAPGFPSFRRTVVLVTNPVDANPDSVAAIPNVVISYPDSVGLLRNDSDVDADPLTVFPGTRTTAQGGTVTLNSSGSFTYRSPAGFTGRDSVRYVMTDGAWRDSAYVILKVTGPRYWFVQPGAVAAGDGRSTTPFNTLSAAGTASSAGDHILVLGADSSVTDVGITLDANQNIYGQGLAANLTHSLMADSVSVTLLTAGAYSTARGNSVGGATITLAPSGNNGIQGLRVTSANGAAISGTGFGTLTLNRVRIASNGGAALNLNTGAISAASPLDSISATGGANSLSLVGVTGSLTVSAGRLSGASTSGIVVNGGSVSLNYQGKVFHAAGGNALLAVSAGHTGTLTFTDSVAATNGTGLQFTNADGTYAFNGATPLNGGDAAVDVLSGSDGTFTFGAGVSVLNPATGAGLNVFESAPASLQFSGSISVNSGRPVLIDGASPCGAITITGSITSTGQGILVQDCSAGTVLFNGTSKSLSTLANPAVTLSNNVGGSVSFTGGGLVITTTSGAGFTATGGGTVQVTGAGNTISTGAARGIDLDSITSGAAGLNFASVSSTAAPNGIRLNNVAGVGLNVNGGAISSSTAHGVSLTSLASGLIVNLDNVTVAGAAPGFAAIFGTNFGNLNGTGTTANQTGGPALNLANGTLALSLANLNASAGPNAVVLGTVNGTLNAAAGALTATSTVFQVTGGNVGGLIATGMTQANGAALISVSGAHAYNGTGALVFSGVLSATLGTGLQFDNADGQYQFSGSTTLNGGDAGVDIINGSAGTFTFSSSVAITSPTGTAFRVDNSGPTITYSGGVSKTAASVGRVVDINLLTGGSVTFQVGTVSSNSTAGTGINISSATGTVSFNGTTTLSGGDNGIDISGGTGAIAFTSGTTVTNPSGIALSVSTGSRNISYAGTIGQTNAASGISVAGATGGTIGFTGTSYNFSTTTQPGVAITNNGANVNFTGGNLNIVTTTGAGFRATVGGVVTVTGAGNTVASGTGIAVEVDETDIGAAGMTFLSVSHSGGVNGIFLDNTGSIAGSFFEVTGTAGTNGSGGTITNTTGGDGATGGNGIYLNGTRNVRLNWMALSGHANNGLFGSGVRGLTMNKMRFTGTNGTSNSGTFDESPVHLLDLGGAVKVTNSRFDGGAYNAFKVENSSGTNPVLDSLVLDTDTVTTMQGSTADVRGSAILVSLTDGSSDTRIRNSRVLQWWGNAIHVLVQSASASGITRITNNFTDNTNGALAGAGGIAVSGGNHQYNISGNTVRHTDGTAISADRIAVGSLMQGTISGNFVGVSGDNGSGTKNGAGIFASHHGPGTTTHRITGNTLRQTQAHSGSGAIWVLTGDASGFGGSGALNATITGNNIQENATLILPINAHNGILVTVGTQSAPTNDTDLACLDIGGAGALQNTIANFNSNTNRIRISARFGTTTRSPGYTGAATGGTSSTDMGTYLVGRNAAGVTSVNQNTSTGGFLNTSPAGSACPQPTL